MVMAKTQFHPSFLSSLCTCKMEEDPLLKMKVLDWSKWIFSRRSKAADSTASSLILLNFSQQNVTVARKKKIKSI